MKQDKDWTDVMRNALRDAELPPPAGGWERLQRELGATAPESAVPATAGVRRPVWRIYMPRIVAAAAAVLVCVVAGEFLFRPDKALEIDGTVIASVAENGATAASIPQSGEPESVQEMLAQRVGLPAERAAGTSSSQRQQSLLAGAPVRTAEATVVSASRAETVQAGDPAADGQTAADQARTHVKADNAAGQTAAESPEREVRTAAKRSAEHSVTRSAADAAGRATSLREPFVAYTRPHKKASFSLFAGGGVTGGGNGSPGPQRMYSPSLDDISSLIGNGDNLSLMQRHDYGESAFRHHQALSFGLAVRKQFAHGLSLESGVNYTLLRSDVRMRYSPEETSQKLHFVGVPLRLNWQFLERGRFSLYIGAGGMVEKCVSARFGSSEIDETGVQWSALAAAGAQYRLGDMVGLYFEPEGSYYFTQTGLRTSRTDSPLTLTLRLGVRLSF